MEIEVNDYQKRSDIKYSDWLQIKDMLTPDFDLTNRKNVELLNKKILKVFYNIDTKTMRLLYLNQIDMLVEKIANIFATPKAELVRVFEYKGIQYGLIPNFENITTGELIDLDALLLEEDMISITSILYRPIIGKVNDAGEYNIEPYKEYNDIFKDIGLDIVEGYIDFFTKSYRILSHYTQESMVGTKKPVIMKMKKMI